MSVTIGDEITRQDGRRFRLAGAQGDLYILQAIDGPFSAPERVSVAELLTGFDVDGVERPETEQELLARLDEEANGENIKYFGRGAKRKPSLPPEGSPEAKFAEASAAAIVGDADALARYEIGELNLAPAVAALVEEHIAERNADAEPTRPRRRRARRDGT